MQIHLGMVLYFLSFRVLSAKFSEQLFSWSIFQFSCLCIYVTWFSCKEIRGCSKKIQSKPSKSRWRTVSSELRFYIRIDTCLRNWYFEVKCMKKYRAVWLLTSSNKLNIHLSSVLTEVVPARASQLLHTVSKKVQAERSSQQAGVCEWVENKSGRNRPARCDLCPPLALLGESSTESGICRRFFPALNTTHGSRSATLDTALH
jgi:hypothetical protein